MTRTPRPPGDPAAAPSAPADRKTRVADALRDNLRRRKDAARKTKGEPRDS